MIIAGEAVVQWRSERTLSYDCKGNYFHYYHYYLHNRHNQHQHYYVVGTTITNSES